MKKRSLACIVFAAFCCTFAACRGGTGGTGGYETKISRNFIFNVSADIVITTNFSDSAISARANQLNRDAKSFLENIEASLSTSVQTSCVYKFNEAAAGEEVEIDRLTYEVLGEAKRVYNLTDGYYNPAVYYCVDLYGFAPNSTAEYPKTGELPAEEYVQAFQSLSTHFGDVELISENGRYYAVKPQDAYVEVDGARYEMKIDLGGIGKGYCADYIGGLFDSYEFKYGFFNFGTSSMAIKQSYETPDNCWELNCVDPRNSLSGYAKFRVSDVALSTSGDYEKYYTVDGVRYCHIIDPTTGSPIRTDIASVTVIGGTAAEGDALTTALSAMGVERAVEFINQKLGAYKVTMLYFDGGEGRIITNCPNDFTVLNGNYKIANSVIDGKIVLNVA